MKKTILLSLFMAFTATIFAQNYKSAVGLRLGTPLALSYKTFISENSAVEAIVGYRSYTGFSYTSVNAAYLLHNNIDAVEGLQWYYGAGVGAYLYSYESEFVDGSTNFGLSGYLGLEYTFANTPISLSVDWVPTYIFGNDFGFGGDGGAFAVRYVLGR